MKILALGTSHTFGRCAPEGDIEPQYRWPQVLANMYGAEVTTLSMSGATFQQQAHIAYRYFADNDVKFDLAVIEGRHMASCDASYPRPKAKGNVNVWDFDSPDHKLFYDVWLTDDKMKQEDRLLPFINHIDTPDESKKWYEEYVNSPLAWTDCYFVNLGLIKFLEQHCSKVKWFSLSKGAKGHHMVDWARDLLQGHTMFWPAWRVSDEHSCGCGHINIQGHKKLAQDIFEEILWKV